MLQIRNLCKVFYEDPKQQQKQLLVLDNVTFSVGKGQFVCLLGPSGCGKTTILRIIVGLTEAEGGEIIVDGNPIKGPGHDRCMVFQNYGLLPWRTVQGNVEFGLEVRGEPESERRTICQRFIEKVGLQGFEHHYPHQLSGGMQQRTGLARALSEDPKILLMDEPFAAVDMQTRESLQEELLNIWQSTQITVLFVTHSVEEAIYLGDRVIVMAPRPGRIKADVPIDLPRPRYASEVKLSPRFSELSRTIRQMLRDGPLTVAVSKRTDVTMESGGHSPVMLRQQHLPESAVTKDTSDRRVNPTQPEMFKPVRKFRLTDYPNAIRAASVSFMLALWEWYGRGVDPIFLSYPTAIVAAAPAMIAKGELQKALIISLQGLAVGFGLAIVIGTILGFLMGRYRLIDYIMDVEISAFYSTPNVALIPLLILWFGLGMRSKIVIIFLAAFFPIIVNTYGGVRNVSRGLVEIAQAEGANEAQIFKKIMVPASLPFIMTGIRLAVGRAVVGMVVAEMFTAITGLGGAIVYYSNNFATSKLFVVIILLALLGVGLTTCVRYLEIKFAPWKETERAS